MKQFSKEYPKISDSNLQELTFCHNFAGQLTSFVIYKSALSKEQLAEISSRLPLGIHDQVTYKSVLTLPQQDIYLAMSAINEDKGTVYNLCGDKVPAALIGNAGVIRLQRPNHVLSLRDIFPLFETCVRM